MNIFEIMCAGGCGPDPEPWKLVVKNIIIFCNYLIPIILLLIGIVMIIKWATKKGPKDKKLLLKGIGFIVLAVIVYILIMFIFVLYALGVAINNYDEVYHCWCS